MTVSKRNRYDQILTGFLIGLIAPLLIFLIFYELKYSQINLGAYIKNIWQMQILLKIMSLCAFPNLGFFFLFYQLKYDLAARGVIMATFIYAFIVLVAKVV
jgi:hypothetical protein